MTILRRERMDQNMQEEASNDQSDHVQAVLQVAVCQSPVKDRESEQDRERRLTEPGADDRTVEQINPKIEEDASTESDHAQNAIDSHESEPEAVAVAVAVTISPEAENMGQDQEEASIEPDHIQDDIDLQQAKDGDTDPVDRSTSQTVAQTDDGPASNVPGLSESDMFAPPPAYVVASVDDSIIDEPTHAIDVTHALEMVEMVDDQVPLSLQDWSDPNIVDHIVEWMESEDDGPGAQIAGAEETPNESDHAQDDIDSQQAVGVVEPRGVGYTDEINQMTMATTPVPGANEQGGEPAEPAEPGSVRPPRGTRPNVAFAVALSCLVLVFAVISAGVLEKTRVGECPLNTRIADLMQMARVRAESSTPEALDHVLLLSSNPDLVDTFLNDASQSRDALEFDLPVFDRATLLPSGRVRFESPDCHWTDTLDTPSYGHVFERYKRVYAMEAIRPANFHRSPFTTYKLYGHIRDKIPAEKLTVLLTQVNCAHMGKIMEANRERFFDRDCLDGAAGRTESFETFSHLIGVQLGMLRQGTAFVDIPEGVSPIETVRMALNAPSKSTKRKERGVPSTFEEFSDSLHPLQAELQTGPVQLFAGAGGSGSTENNFKALFPGYHVGFIGLAGSGKSTTLRWLAFYAGLKTATRSAFMPARSGGQSFTRFLVQRGMGEEQNPSFTGLDTMGLDPPLNASFASTDLVWLAEGRVPHDQEMKWIGDHREASRPQFPGFGLFTFFYHIVAGMFRMFSVLSLGPPAEPGEVSYTPWKEEASVDRAMHSLVFVQRYIDPFEMETLREIKTFLQALRSSMTPLGIQFTIALTHLDGCDEKMSIAQCVREFAENVDVGFDEVVALPGLEWHRDEVVHASWDKLEGTVAEEIAATGVHLDPDCLLELVKRIKQASHRFYEPYYYGTKSIEYDGEHKPSGRQPQDTAGNAFAEEDHSVPSNQEPKRPLGTRDVDSLDSSLNKLAGVLLVLLSFPVLLLCGVFTPTVPDSEATALPDPIMDAVIDTPAVVLSVTAAVPETPADMLGLKAPKEEPRRTKVVPLSMQDYDGPRNKDATPDKRYKVQLSAYCALPRKTDGTPDERTKEYKKYQKNQFRVKKGSLDAVRTQLDFSKTV